MTRRPRAGAGRLVLHYHARDFARFGLTLREFEQVAGWQVELLAAYCRPRRIVYHWRGHTRLSIGLLQLERPWPGLVPGESTR